MGTASLKFRLHREVERESSEIKHEQLLVGIVHSRMGSSKRMLNLLNRRQYFRRIERETTEKVCSLVISTKTLI